MKWAVRGRDVVHVSGFRGRGRELEDLRALVGRPATRIVAVRAMGGMGKTWLVRKAWLETSDFADKAWVSLVNDPDPARAIRSILEQLGVHAEADAGTEELLDFLADRMSQSRCLIVLDNVETAIEAMSMDSEIAEAYDELLWMVSTREISRVVLTTRELPPTFKEIGKPAAVDFVLSGLDDDAVWTLLTDRGISVARESVRDLAGRYGGNPQLLTLAAGSIDSLGGDIGAFLTERIGSLEEGSDLFEWHFNRANEHELECLFWLAILREPSEPRVLDELVWPSNSGRGSVSSTLARLCDAGLVQVTEHREYGLQPAMLAHVTDYLVRLVVDGAIATIEGDERRTWFDRVGFSVCGSTDRIRERNSAEISVPVMTALREKFGPGVVDEALGSLLSAMRTAGGKASGYGPSNILALWRSSSVGRLTRDLSGLTFRQVDYSDMDLAGIDLRKAEFVGCRFASTFGNVLCIDGHEQAGLIATAGTDNVVWLWRADGNAVGRLPGHSNWVRGVAFSPDGSRLASVASDGMLRVWDVERLRCEHAIAISERRLWAVVWLSESEVAIGGDSGEVFRVSVRDNRTDVEWSECHGGRAIAVCTFGSGRVLSAGWDGSVAMWHPEASTPVRVDVGGAIVAVGGGGLPQAVIALADGRLVGVSIVDDRIAVRNIARVDGVPTAVAVSSQTGQGCIGLRDGSIIRLSLTDGQMVASTSAHDSQVTSAEVVGDVLVTAGEDHSARLWRLVDGAPLGRLTGGLNHAWSVGALGAVEGGDVETILSAHEDKAVRVWGRNRTGGWEIRRLLKGHRNRVWSVRPSVSGEFAVTASEDCTARVWDLKKGLCLRVFDEHHGPVWSAAFDSRSHLVFTGGDEGLLRAWASADGRLTWALDLGARRIRAVVVGAGDRWIAAAGEYSGIVLADCVTGRRLKSLEGHRDRINALAAGHDKSLASGSRDGTVRLWMDPIGNEGQSVCIEVGDGYVWAVAQDVRGGWLCAGTESGAVHLFDRESGSRRWKAAVSASRIKWLSPTAEGGDVLACSEDGAILILEAATGHVLRRLRGARLYEGMRIDGVTGIGESTIDVLKELGAVDGAGEAMLDAGRRTPNVPDNSPPEIDVFISYARGDAELAEHIAKELEARGLRVFVDVNAIHYGARFESVIEQSIDVSKAVVLLMSPDSEESRWVTRERLHAESRDVRIFPVLISGRCFFSLQEVHFEDVRVLGRPSTRFYDDIEHHCAR